MRDKEPKVDYLVPIIADGDAGFGGITSVMKLVRMFIDFLKDWLAKESPPSF